MLNHDRKGFLIPDSKTGADELTHGIKGLKHDTAAIIQLLKGQTKSTVLQRARISNPNSSSRASVNPGGATRDSRGRYQSQPVAGVERAVRQMTRQQTQQAAAEARNAAAARNREGVPNERERETNGRFGAGEGDDDKGGKDGLFSRLKSALSGTGAGDAGDLDKVDPAIEAANELKNLVGGPLKSIGELGGAVLGRGFSGEAKDKSVPWYRRMLVQLKLMRKDDGVFQRTELRRLEEIRNGGGGGGSEGPGFFGTLMGTLFGRIGPMILAGVATVGGALLTGIGTVLGVIFSPIGLAIAAAAALAWLAFAEDGRKFFSTIGARIAGAWDVAVKEFGAIWKPIGDFLKNTLGMAVEVVIETVAPAIEAVKETVAPAVAAVKEKAAPVIAAVKEKAAPAIKAAERAYNVMASQAGSVLETVMPKGYRHKALFDGIKGGDKLTEYGRYTDNEADKIKQLKGSGANTSANIKGGMPKEIQEQIIAKAKSAGLDPAMMLKIAAMESGGNANAISSTGAIGIYQFVGKTASGVGIKNRFDVDQNIAGGMRLTQENMASLKKSKLPVTAENLYMMLQLGPNAAKEVISGAARGKNISSLSAGTQKAISLNYGAGVKTASEYLGKNSAALTARADTVIGKSATDFLPTAPDALPSLASTMTAPAARAGAVSSAANEKDRRASLANTGAIPLPLLASTMTAPAASSSMAMPSVSVSAATAPVQAPRADAPLPLNRKGPLEVTVRNDKLAGQDVRDRRIAQIATGIYN